MTAGGTTQRSFTIDVKVASRPLIKAYVHGQTARETVEFSEPKKLTG